MVRFCHHWMGDDGDGDDGLCCRFGAKQTDGAERVGRGLDEVGQMIFDKMWRV